MRKHPDYLSSRETVLEGVLWVSSSNTFRQLLGAVTTFLRPLLLAPAQIGLFTFLRVFLLYAQYLHVGLRTGMRYMIPAYEGIQQTDKITLLKGTALKVSLALNLTMGAALVFMALIRDEMSNELRVGLVFIAIIAVGNCIVDHFAAELKGHQKFKLVGFINYISAIALLVASVPLMLWFGLYGALAAQLVATIAVLGWLFTRRNAGPRPGFDWTILKTTAAIGLPTMLFDIGILLVRTVDRFVISMTVGFEQLGYYAIGTMIVGYLLNIPGAAREVMEGKMFRELDAHSKAELFRQYALQPMVGISFTMPWIIGPVYLALPVLIETFLPDYLAGVEAAQLLCLANWFLAISFSMRAVLIANRWQYSALAILCGVLLLHLGLSWWWLGKGGGIEMVAISNGIAFLVLLIAILAMAVLRLPERPTGLIRACLIIAGMAFATFAVLFVLEQLRWSESIWTNLLVQGLAFGVFLSITALLAIQLHVLPPALIQRLFRKLKRITHDDRRG